LRQEIEQTGFSLEQDAITPKAVYDDWGANRFGEDLYDDRKTSKRSKEERKPEGHASRMSKDRGQTSPGLSGGMPPALGVSRVFCVLTAQ